jgi:menaquinone-9 beta-reductase
MTQSPSPDVLIAGAGPAGSALAVRLSRQGHRVLVVDRARFPRDKPCSEYLSPAAVALLSELGVVDRLLQDGAQPLLGTRVIAPCGAELTGRFPGSGAGSPPARGLSVARRILDARLVEAARAAGAEVREACVVEELLYEQGAVAGAVLRDRGGAARVVRARVVIGADGLRSVVARRIGRRRHGMPSRLALVAHVGDVTGLDGHAEMHVGETGYVGLNRIGAAGVSGSRDNVANVALVVPRRVAGAASGRVNAFFFEQLQRFPGVAGRVRPELMVREILVTGPFAAWSGRIVVDGALLVGDAADFFDPFTGEGIFSALKGAELAAAVIDPALRAGTGVLPAWRLQPYRAARRATFTGKWLVERLVGYGMLAPRLFNRAVRNLNEHGLGDTFVGVTADLLPARAVLNPAFLSRMVL